jgi:hypothetical protein
VAKPGIVRDVGGSARYITITAWILAIVIAVALAGYCAYATLTYALGCSALDRGCWSHTVPRSPPVPEQTAKIPGGVQNATVLIGIDSVTVTIPIRLSRTDPAAHAYLGGGLDLSGLVRSVGDLNVDGNSVAYSASLRRTAFRLSRTTLAIDVGTTFARTSFAARLYGEHHIGVATPNRLYALRVKLEGVAFARSHAFGKPPDSVTGLANARWNAVPSFQDLAVNVDLVTPESPLRRFRAAIEAAFRSAGWWNVVSQLAFALWPIVAIVATLRVLPRGRVRALRSASYVLIAAAVGTSFGYSAYSLAFLVPHYYSTGFAPYAASATILFVPVLAAAAACLAAITRRRAGRRRDLRPWVVLVATMTLFHATALFERAAAQPAGSILVSTVFSALSTLVAFAVASAILLLALRPKTLASYALAGMRWAPLAAAAIVAFVVIAAAVCRIVLPVVGRPFASTNAVAASFGAGADVVGLAMPIVGLLALVCGFGLSLGSPRRMHWWTIVLLIAVWCIGLNDTVLTVPLPALLALLTVPLIALRPAAECAVIANAKMVAAGDRDALFELALRRTDVDAAQQTVRRLQDKYLSADLTGDQLAAQCAELERFSRFHLDELKKNDPDGIVSSLFTSFPMVAPLAAARQAGIVGAVIGAITVAVGFADLVRSSLTASQPLLQLGETVAQAVARSAVAAFVFVLFLPYFRGSAATAKGLLLGIAALLAALPSLLSTDVPQQAIVDAATGALFFPIVGAVFDVMALRRHATELSLARIFGLAGLGNFAAIGTVLASAIITAVTGQLQHVAGSLVSGALHTPTSITEPQK